MSRPRYGWSRPSRIRAARRDEPAGRSEAPPACARGRSNLRRPNPAGELPPSERAAGRRCALGRDGIGRPGPAADPEPEGADRAGTDPRLGLASIPISASDRRGEPPEQPAGSPPSVVPSAWQRDSSRSHSTSGGAGSRGEYEVDDFGFDPDLTAKRAGAAAAAGLPHLVPHRGDRNPQPATRGRGSSRRQTMRAGCGPSTVR